MFENPITSLANAKSFTLKITLYNNNNIKPIIGNT